MDFATCERLFVAKHISTTLIVLEGIRDVVVKRTTPVKPLARNKPRLSVAHKDHF